MKSKCAYFWEVCQSGVSQSETERKGKEVWAKDSWYCSFEWGMDKMYDEKWKKEEKERG